jgi:K+-transporting ATPase C subunit
MPIAGQCISSHPRQTCNIWDNPYGFVIPDIESKLAHPLLHDFAYHEICNKRVHKKETVMNSGEVMMSNACRVVRGVREAEASNGGMNMSRCISKGVLSLALSLVIYFGLYLLSLSVIGRGVFPIQANSRMLAGPDSKVVDSSQTVQPFTKGEYFQPRSSAASYDASASTSSAVAASNNIVDQNRDFGVAEDPSLQRPTERVCLFYGC